MAGVSGNGQRELVEVLAGQRQAVAVRSRYRISLITDSRNIMNTRCLSPRRTAPEHVCRAHDVSENLAFRNFDIEPHAVGGWLISRLALRRSALDLIGRYNIKPPIPTSPFNCCREATCSARSWHVSCRGTSKF